MSVTINSILFSDEYTGLPSGNGSDTGVPYLMGCVGDLIWCNIDFYVSWSALDILADFSTSKTITRKTCGILSGSFILDGFQKGDTIIITGAGDDNGTYTIASVTDSVITTVETIITNGSFTGVNIYGVTTVNYFDFYYNIVGNNQRRQPLPNTFNSGRTNDFTSLTDSKATQKFSGTSSIYYAGNATLQPNSTSRAWWNNSISGVNSLPVITQLGSTVDHKQHFTLQFPFLITPLFLANQLQILQNSYKQGGLSTATGTINNTTYDQPEYFTEQCLKFIYQIDAKFKITNPTVDHSTQNTVTFNDGNTAWFNSFFPSGVYLDGNVIVKQVYDLRSISYASGTLSSIYIENPTAVSCLIQGHNTESLTNAPMVLNFMWLPTDSAKYQGYSQPNQADFREVFLHDRAKTTIGAGAVNGDQFGTSLQAITNFTATAISSARFRIDFTIDLGSLSKSTLENDGVNNRNYLIWLTPQSSDCTKLENSDRSAILIDVNQAFLDTDDPTLLTIITDGTTDTHYHRYPDTTTNPVTNFSAFITEYGLLKNQFKIKPDCILQDISVYTVVQIISDDIYDDTVFSEFAIDQWVNNTSGFWDGTENNITINQTRGFDLPAGSQYNVASINARPDLIVDGKLVYEIIYGFQLGYQYWQQLSNFPEYVNNYPTQYYAAYTVGTTSRGVAPKQPWVSINPPGKRTVTKHKIVWNVTDTNTGIITEFIHYSDIAAYDEQSKVSDINTVTIGTQDDYGSNLNGIVATDVPTNITAQIHGNLDIPAGYSSVIGELAVSYQVGNKTIFDRITTLDNSPETANSLWTTKLTMTITATVTPTVSNAILFATFDASQSDLPITNVRIYAKISFEV